MDTDAYHQQLQTINQMLEQCSEGPEKDELLSLKQNIEELLSLTVEESSSSIENVKNDSIDDEYALFMAEMAKEGVVDQPSTTKETEESLSKTSFKDLEGKKFRAPHKHQWGQTAYHNAMVCSVPDEIPLNKEFEVKVLFLNPTHQDMQPCPYYFNLEKDCKFSEEKCRFSHGQDVSFSSLQEYVEPKFDSLTIGSQVLAKQANNLWYRAKIKHISNETCLVRFEAKDRKDEEIIFEHILPLENWDSNSGSTSESIEDSEDENDSNLVAENDQNQEVINMSLLNNVSDQALGVWEKHTKGIGSRLMQKMGYIVGTGLGKDSGGRIDPVPALILPPGKSLDYCMKLKEKHGNDQNLFSADRKLKRMQKRQEIANQRAYARSEQKKDVFSFINNALNKEETLEKEGTMDKNKFRESLKGESEKGLNVANFVIEEHIRKCERSIDEYKMSLKRHLDVSSQSHKKIMDKLSFKQNELNSMKAQAMSIKNEQQLRTDKKKMSIF